MSSPQTDDALLLIRCPQCGQRFRVEDGLRGRSVECGGCEHRFRIADEVIVRGQKVYPGERLDPKLDRFQRVPLAPETAGHASVRYVEVPDAAVLETTVPQRVIAAMIGVLGMLIIGLLLMFGSYSGGMLDGMTAGNQLLMAGFTGLLGIVLLIYANPRARIKAFGAGVLLSAVLLALPFYITNGVGPSADLTHKSLPAAPVPAPAGPTSETTSELRSRIGTTPLETEINRLAQSGSAKQAIGLWLKGLSEQNRLLARDYILRVTGADPQTIFYPRGNGNFLVVVTGITKPLTEVAQLVTALGTLEKVYPEIAVVEILVNNESFGGGAGDAPTNKQESAFYDINNKDLESIDLDRVGLAVKRLADAAPKIYRADITRKLLLLLEKPEVTFKGDICRALAVWSEQAGPAGDAALKEATELLARKQKVPPAMIALVVKEKNRGVVPVLDELWAQNPTTWESLFGDVGPPAEAALLHRFASADGMLRQSAVRLLGRVGGAASLPVLAAASGTADTELKIMLEQATASIRLRLGR